MSNQQKWPKPIEYNLRFKDISKLRSCDEYDLWLCERRDNRTLQVRKEYKQWRPKQWGKHKTSYEIWLMHNAVPPHRNILQVLTYAIEKPNLGLEIYFPYCRGGSLTQYQTHLGRGVPESFIWDVFKQLADALAFLHHGYDRIQDYPARPPKDWQAVVHRNVEPSSVYLRDKENRPGGHAPHLYLSDFDFASTINETTSDIRDQTWQGPEWPLVTRKTDVWGLGAIIHALCLGQAPIVPPPKNIPVKEWRTMPESKYAQRIDHVYSSDLDENMDICLQRNPKNRVNSKSLVINVVHDEDRFRRHRASVQAKDSRRV